MINRRRLRWTALSWIVLLGATTVQAQMAVVDVASIRQLVQQVQTLSQQLAAARQQIAQTQALYQSLIGDRGMEQLLANTPRNYLPSDWLQLTAAMPGTTAPGSALALDIRADVAGNSVLTAPQLAALTPDAQRQITNDRQSVALLQALSQEALANSSGRFAALQQLIGAIASARDQKAILDLQARINAEQGMLQNEQTKLQILNQAAHSQAAIAAQQTRELIIAGQGHFATRFEPTPPPAVE
jgi:type IV secretion system protein VirB5